jgi:hypothetical protein
MHSAVLVTEEDERDGVRYTATFSPEPEPPYRYTLGRTWDTTLPTVTFLMLNPSTADARRDDATIRRCLGFARSWQAGGLLVVNLYALRATNPAELLTHPDAVGPDNDAVLAAHLPTTSGPLVLAWGAHRAAAARADHVHRLLRQHGVRPRCLGTTGGGHPRHPLRLLATTQLLECPRGRPVTEPATQPTSADSATSARPPATKPTRETRTMATAGTLTRTTTPAAPRCTHKPSCPDAAAVDHLAARVIAAHPDQGWSLLCNGVILFDDGELLPDGTVIDPRRGPAPHTAAAG